MYIINIFKYGKLEYTELASREVAMALCHLCNRLNNSGLTAQIEVL